MQRTGTPHHQQEPADVMLSVKKNNSQLMCCSRFSPKYTLAPFRVYTSVDVVYTAQQQVAGSSS